MRRSGRTRLHRPAAASRARLRGELHVRRLQHPLPDLGGLLLCLWCLSPLSRLLGVAFENESLLTFADTLLKPFAILVVSEVFVIGFGLLFMLSPTRSILKVFRYTIPVSLVGLLAFAIALLIHSGDTLHANFDNYVQDATGVPNATAAAEKSSGFALAPFALGATLLAVTWPCFSLPYYLGSAYFAGEVRNARRAQLLAGPVTALVAVVGSLILIWLSLGRLGGEFLGAITSADPAALGFGGSPTYMEVAAGSSGSTILGILILVGFGSWLVPTVPMSLLIMSRCMFGWSMDRIAPDALSKVSPRTGAPYVAVGVVTLISAVISYFWAYTDFFTVVVGAFAQIITLGIGCLAVSLLPYKRKDLYDTAPIRGYIGPIPKLTLIGVLGAIGAALIVINFARDESSGVNPSVAPTMFWISLAMFPFRPPPLLRLGGHPSPAGSGRETRDRGDRTQ